MIRCITTAANSRITETELKHINLLRNNSLIDVTNPSMGEIREIHERFKIAVADMKYCLDPYESPRIKQTKDYILIIYNEYHCEEDAKKCAPIGFFFTRRYTVVIHTEKVKVLDELDLNAQLTKQMFHAGTEVILLHILHNLTKDMTKRLQSIEDELEGLEDDVLNARDEGVMHKIFSLKNTLLYLRKAVTGNRNVINGLIKDVPIIKEKALFAELNVEVMQLSDVIEIYRERLTSIVEIHMSSMSNKINVIMKYFTVIASILLLPMLVTGLYGMNLALPFQQHPQAFWIVLGIMIACIFLMLFFFSKKKWL